MRKPLTMIKSGKFKALDPTHNIRCLGLKCYMYLTCPGIGNFHTGVCNTNNKEHFKEFIRRKRRLAAQQGSRATSQANSEAGDEEEEVEDGWGSQAESAGGARQRLGRERAASVPVERVVG